MADENVIDDTDAEDNVEAQKALDDLTVLSNVGNQDMGAARLNNPRPVDVSEGALGGLANIHQGSETAPSVQEGLDVDVGAIEERGVTLESAPLTVAEAPPPAPEVVAQAEAPEAAPETAPRETVQPILAPAAPVFTPPTPEAVVDQPVVEQMPLPEVEVIDAPLAIEQTVPEAPVDELRLDLPPVVGDIRVIFRDEDPTDPTDPNVDPNLASFDLTGKEGHDIHFRIDAFDPDGGSVSINFSAGAHGFVAVDPQTGDYVYHPTGSNWYGDDTVTVYVRDDEGNVVSRAITINVANVDEVVNVTGGTGDESNNSNATVVTGSLATPETEGALSYAVVGNGEHHGSFSVNADGTFTFTAYDNNWNGTDTFTVEVVDDAGGVTQVPVTITVNA
ncbi:MAG: cadherin-like domain-containing protein, partial [Rhodospirillaceae bacterium]|nr:cadherin-like domain-containing protein [Rhodospirillales bacterium]